MANSFGYPSLQDVEDEILKRDISKMVMAQPEQQPVVQQPAQIPDSEMVINPAGLNQNQSKVSEILNQVSSGYKDNTQNSFALNNFARDPNKSGWNMLGEALGTGQRILGNPYVQGAIAAAIYGSRSKNMGKGLEYGINWAQNKAKSDYYAKAMGANSGILGGYGATDYNAYTNSQYKDVMAKNAELKVEALLDKYSPKMGDYALAMKVSGNWTPEQYEAFINLPDFNPDGRVSLETIKEMTNRAYKMKDIELKEKDTNSKINRRDVQNKNDTTRVNIYGQSVANTNSHQEKQDALKKKELEEKIKGGYFNKNNNDNGDKGTKLVFD